MLNRAPGWEPEGWSSSQLGSDSGNVGKPFDISDF